MTHHHTGIDEITSHRVARETGATVTVTRVGPGSVYEQEPGWMTMCLNHGLLVFHQTRRLAEWHAAMPSGWCADCARIATGHAPKITTGKVL